MVPRSSPTTAVICFFASSASGCSLRCVHFVVGRLAGRWTRSFVARLYNDRFMVQTVSLVWRCRSCSSSSRSSTSPVVAQRQIHMVMVRFPSCCTFGGPCPCCAVAGWQRTSRRRVLALHRGVPFSPGWPRCAQTTPTRTRSCGSGSSLRSMRRRRRKRRRARIFWDHLPGLSPSEYENLKKTPQRLNDLKEEEVVDLRRIAAQFHLEETELMHWIFELGRRMGWCRQ